MQDEFRRIIDALPELIWTALPNGIVDFVNRCWTEYTGQRFEDSCGRGWEAAIHPEDRPGLLREWRCLLASGKQGEIAVRLCNAAGAHRWFTLRVRPLVDEAGEVTKWCGAFIDIEAIARTKEELRPEEIESTSVVNLKSVIDTIPMTAWSTEADGFCDFCNKRWLDYAGVTLDQVQGWGWEAVIHPDDLDRLVKDWKSCLASGSPVNSEARMRRYDGVYRWFLFLGNPLRDKSGNIVKWFGTNVEIEDRKRAEEELKAKERDLVRTINTIPTPAFSTLPDGYVDFLNQRWLDYAGMTAEQAQGWGWKASLHPDDTDRVVRYWQSCLDSGAAAELEARYRRFDGAYRWCLVRADPLRDESGKVVKWYGISIDIEDRKRAEEELRAKERDLIQIINTIPTTAWATRPDGFCEFLSDRWLDYAGYTYEQAVGWRWADVIHPDDAPGLQEHWLSCLATGTPVNAEARMRRFDGVYRWFLFLAKPLRDKSGNIVKWYGTNVDIEDRKQADHALRANERTLYLIINTIPMLAWSTDPTGFVEFLNQRWLDFTGLSAEEASGFGWSVAIHPDDAKGLIDYWQAALTSGKEVDVEARLRRFDGQYRWFLFRASPLRDDSGNIIKWYGTNVDIEDRKRADEELRRSEAFLAEGQRLNLSGSFSWRPDTDEFIFSDQLYRIYEFELGSPVTIDRIASRVHPEDISLVADQQALARAGHNDLNFEFRLRMSDGSIRYLRTVAHAMLDREGRREMIGAVQDVTERRLAEEALSKTRSELAHMARVTSLGALTASIAHEVNQPLAGIVTNASTCLRMLSSEPPNVEGALETARRSIRDGKRASEVIARLRGLFGKKEAVTEIVDLNDATREVIALLLSELQRNRVKVRQELTELLPLIIGDRVQLQQVILNLLLNALDAMAGINDRSRLLVIQTAEEIDDSVRLTVRDTGVGIDEGNRDRIFEAFYSTKTGGMGMGLSISRTIIESHRGRIWVEPNAGLGSAFSFSIPCGGCSRRGGPYFVQP
jgi:PAS domain S-box-containing protein